MNEIFVKHFILLIYLFTLYNTSITTDGGMKMFFYRVILISSKKYRSQQRHTNELIIYLAYGFDKDTEKKINKKNWYTEN